MREILFRGRDACGRWHYGVPLVFSDAYVCITDPYTFNKSVERETVGQYIGLTDKNGIKIFEGDIVRMDLGFCGKQNDRYIVEFSGHGFGFRHDTSDSTLYAYRAPMEVIGNIYDNPELMEA